MKRFAMLLTALALVVTVPPAAQASPAALAAPTAPTRAASAEAARPAVFVAPRRPLPDDDVEFTGRLGSGTRPVVLQKGVNASWKPLARGKTRKGAYRLTTRWSDKPTARYRVLAPAAPRRAGLVSSVRTVTQATGTYYWRQWTICREGGGVNNIPRIDAACDKVTSIFRRTGYHLMREFTAAAGRGDTETMRALSREGRRIPEQFEGVEFAKRDANFYWFKSDTQWAGNLYLKGLDRWVEYFGELETWQVEDELPTWKIDRAYRNSYADGPQDPR